MAEYRWELDDAGTASSGAFLAMTSGPDTNYKLKKNSTYYANYTAKSGTNSVYITGLPANTVSGSMQLTDSTGSHTSSNYADIWFYAGANGVIFTYTQPWHTVYASDISHSIAYDLFTQNIHLNFWSGVWQYYNSDASTSPGSVPANAWYRLAQQGVTVRNSQFRLGDTRVYNASGTLLATINYGDSWYFDSNGTPVTLDVLTAWYGSGGPHSTLAVDDLRVSSTGWIDRTEVSNKFFVGPIGRS
jgi:hypothetical protein